MFWTNVKRGTLSFKKSVLGINGAVGMFRGVSSSKKCKWDEVRVQTHPTDTIHMNPYIKVPKTVSIIGAPMTHGQPLLGTDAGTQMMRDAGLNEGLVNLGWRIEETGDLTFQAPSPNDPVLAPEFGLAKQCYAVGKGIKQLHDLVSTKAKEGKFCLILGGDHTIGAGSVAGVLSARPDTGVIWVDAHADINTPTISGSGNMHGMPVAFVLQHLIDHSKIPGFEWMEHTNLMKPEQIVYIGLRDVDASERRLIKQLGIKAFSMQDVDRYGIGRTMEIALDHLCGERERPLHMSYDIDAVDPVIAPSTGTTVRGGLTWREAHYVAEAVMDTNLLCSLDMVEVNPTLVPGKGADSTVDMALLLTKSAMGNSIL